MPQAPAATAAHRDLPPAGLLLAGVRQVRRWTRPQLARELGWKTARLAAVEQGREPVAREELSTVVQALGLGAWELQFATEYFRAGGGRVPGDGEWNPHWEAFLLALEVGQVAYRFLSLFERAARAHAGKVPS